MGDRTSIEWTRGDDGKPGATWNPLVGCSRTSPGCDHCYAETQAPRQKGTTAYEGVVGPTGWTGRVNVLRERFDQPLRWRRPRRIFVNSMSDLFHESVAVADIAEIFAVMSLAPQHTFQLLTKRSKRMMLILSDSGFPALVDSFRGPEAGDFTWPLPNVWNGVSVESGPYVFRVDHLDATPAAVRWASVEPFIAPIPDLDRLVAPLDWCVVGGESGRHARPLHPAWALAVRDACRDAGVPFLFKQWGQWLPVRPVYEGADDAIEHDPLDFYDDPATPLIGLEESGTVATRDGVGRQPHPGSDPWWCVGVGKHAAGRELDGQFYDEYPEAQHARA